MSGQFADQPRYPGWHLMGFDSELVGDVSPLQVGDRPLVAVRESGRVRVFDAICPHRGAHLGYGGVLDGECLICPFHGRRVRLGASAALHSVAEHPSSQLGPALFTLLDAGPDRGLGELLDSLRRTHEIAPALTCTVRAPAALVVENAFDGDHFVTVHGLRRSLRMTVTTTADGALAVDGQLEALQAPPWEDQAGDGRHRSRFYARAFSPTVVITEIGPPGRSPIVITGAVPVEDGCLARVVLAVPHATGGATGSEAGRAALLAGLVAGSQRAFAQDIEIWEHLDHAHVAHFEPRDAGVLAFRDFCDAAGS